MSPQRKAGTIFFLRDGVLVVFKGLLGSVFKRDLRIFFLVFQRDVDLVFLSDFGLVFLSDFGLVLRSDFWTWFFFWTLDFGRFNKGIRFGFSDVGPGFSKGRGPGFSFGLWTGFSFGFLDLVFFRIFGSGFSIGFWIF
jgi:hypothetical protein